MQGLAAGAARSHQLDEKALRISLAEIAHRSYGDGTTVNQALEQGWKQGMAHSTISPDEEDRPKKFNNQVAPTAVPRIQAS